MGQQQSCAGLSTPAQRRAVFGGSKPSVEAIAELIRAGRARKILVVAGAGISVSAGIPDFRTPGTGLYANLQRFRLPRPEAIFDINFFSRNPRPFFALAREMFPGMFDPTPTHFFLRLLAEKGLLRRIYTQNIDTLERIAGIPADKLVEAHGSFATSTCRKCGANYDLAWLKSKLLPVEEAAAAAAGGSSSSPSSASSSPADLTKVRMSMCDAPGCGGLVKPDITFFGEDLPARFHRLAPDDAGEADMVLVLGTSLQVYPVGAIPFHVEPFVPRLLINREAVGLEAGYESPDEEDDAKYCDADAARAAEMELARVQLRAQITAAKAAARAAGRAAATEAAAAMAEAASGTAASVGAATAASSSVAASAGSAADSEAVADAAVEVDPEVEAEVEEAMAVTYGGRGGQRFRTPAKFIFGRGGNYRDVHLAGDCDAGVLRLAELLGWSDELAAVQARELERIRHERLGAAAPCAASAAAPPTTPAASKPAASTAAESSAAAACGGAGAVAEAPLTTTASAPAEKPSGTEAAISALEDAVSKLSL